MNNSFLTSAFVDLSVDEPVFDLSEIRKRDSKLVKTIEAIRKIRATKEWSTLKAEVFDGLTAFLETELLAESKKTAPDTQKLNRLSGQLMWATRFSDLESLETEFSQELNNIRKTYGTTKENPATGGGIL